MRCFPNPYHHSFALGKSTRDNLNHINFMVTDINDIGIARNRMIDHNIPIVFGPGRHAPSDSIFLYFLDPDGLTNEYSFGMEEFPEQDARKPRMLEKSLDILDTWGGRTDPRFGTTGKIETVS
ncbi:VOC family protein [Effusibacillus dendaii]